MPKTGSASNQVANGLMGLLLVLVSLVLLADYPVSFSRHSMGLFNALPFHNPNQSGFIPTTNPLLIVAWSLEMCVYEAVWSTWQLPLSRPLSYLTFCM